MTAAYWLNNSLLKAYDNSNSTFDFNGGSARIPLESAESPRLSCTKRYGVLVHMS